MSQIEWFQGRGYSVGYIQGKKRLEISPHLDRWQLTDLLTGEKYPVTTEAKGKDVAKFILATEK